MPTLRRTFFWLFRNRKTGRITVVQWPNIPLAAFLLATVIHLVVRSGTAVSTVLGAVASAALAIWAVLEIARGVNPFRRSLGSVVLILVIVSALVVFGREFLITGLRFVAANQGVVVASTPWGKSKTFSQNLMIGLLILEQPYPVLHVPALVMVGLAVTATVLSGLDYLWRYRRFVV